MKKHKVAAVFLAALLTSACDRLGTSGPSDVGSIQINKQVAPVASPGILMPSMFWMNGSTYGCETTGKPFAMFKFDQNTVVIHNGRKMERVSIGFQPGNPVFNVQSSSEVLTFKPSIESGAALEGHIQRFDVNGSKTVCFLWQNGMYTPTDGSAVFAQSVQGTWDCDKKLGRVSIDAMFRFKGAGISGHSVLSALTQSPDDSFLYILAGVDKTGLAQGVYGFPVKLSRASGGVVKLGDDVCKKASSAP